MADEWRQVTIADIAEVYDGPHATPKKTASGPIFLGISNLSNGRLDLGESEHLSEEDYVKWTRRVAPRAGDVVFSYETRLGEAAIVPDALRCCLGRRMGLLRVKRERADPRFVLYTWLSPAFREVIRQRTVPGSTVDRIPIMGLPDFPVRIPPLDEQRSIAHILGTLDDKIELNRRMSNTLEAMARALFKSWFVDFEPVRAKAEGRDPGLPREIADLLPARLVDSKLGEIPEGWECQALPEAIDVNPARQLRKGQIAPYLDMANMPTAGHRASSVVARPYGSGTRYSNGDTLLARITPCLENGKTAFVDFLQDGETGWGSTEYIVLRPRPPLPAEFGYYLARDEGFRNHVILNMTGTSGRQRAPASALARYFIAAPPSGVGAAFGDLARSAMAKIRAYDEEMRTLASLRDALLPKLISGELRVADAAKSSAEVA